MKSPSPDHDNLWNSVLDRLRACVSEQQFETWFHGVVATECTPDTIELAVPNSFSKEWIRKRYAETIVSEAQLANGGSRPALRIEVLPSAAHQELSSTAVATAVATAPEPRSEANSSPRPGMARPPRERSRLESSETRPLAPLNPRYTMENLVVGQANALARAAISAVALGEKGYNPLFIHSGVGMGKTHILHALCHAWSAEHPEKRLVHTTAEQFLNAYITAIDRSEVAQFRRHFRDADLLVVDDIQGLAHKERTQNEFLHTFNVIVDSGRQVVVSADRAPEEISGLNARLASCLKWGMVCRVDAPTAPMRRSIVDRLTAREEVAIPDEVADFIADAVRSNARELIGACTRVIGTATLSGTPVSLALAHSVLSDVVGQRRHPVTIDQIAAVVTRRYGVRLAELQSRRRTKDIVVPRQVCMHLARRLTGTSLEAVGRYFGGRDHSTVLYALERVEAMVADESFRRHIEELCAEILREEAQD